MKTALAPRARALKMSVPLVAPPSMYTSILSPTALTISSRTSIYFSNSQASHYNASTLNQYTSLRTHASIGKETEKDIALQLEKLIRKVPSYQNFINQLL